MQQSANKTITAGFAILMMVLSHFMASPVWAQQKLEWRSFEEAAMIADSTQRPIFVDVWAPWCGWCRKMKREVYPELRPQLEGRFVLTRLNRDDNSASYNYMGSNRSPMRIAQVLKTQSVPAIVLLNAEGEYLMHLSGFMETEKLRPVLDYISSSAYQSMRFDNYKDKKDIYPISPINIHKKRDVCALCSLNLNRPGVGITPGRSGFFFHLFGQLSN